MAFLGLFHPDDFDLPSIAELRWGWAFSMPHALADIVAQEYQNLLFHKAILEKLHTRSAAIQNANTYPIGLALRAGLVKSTLMLGASLLEAVLRSIAEQRNLELPNNPRHRTYGKVMASWCNPAGNFDSPIPDVAEIWPTVRALKELRDNVHIFAAAEEGDGNAQQGYWDGILALEHTLLPQIEPALAHLRTLSNQ